MVEVFKTNVIDAQDADHLLDQIHACFSHYKANFALDDCDKILRINCTDGCIVASEVIAILKMNGFEATILPDDSEINLYASLGKDFA